MSLVASSYSDTAPPVLQLRNQGAQRMLDYQPTPSQGAAILHFSSDLSILRTTNRGIFDVPAGSGIIPVDVTGMFNGGRGFFSITEFPGRSAADWATDEPEAEEPITEYLTEVTTPVTYPLIANQAVTVAFQLIDAMTGDPSMVGGNVTLRLVDAGGQPVGIVYTLVPSSLPVVNGAVSGSVTVQTTAPLADVYIAVASVVTGAGMRVRGSPQGQAVSGMGIIRESTKALTEYQQPLPFGPGAWRHPFHGITFPITGNYGEWRESDGNTAGRAHAGLDLAAPVGMRVYPVAKGVVARVGWVNADHSLGCFVVVNHGNGYATRYLHISPLVQEHQIVEAAGPGTAVGTVAAIAHPHFHLEIRQSCKSYYRKIQPEKPPAAAFETGESPGPGTHYDPLRDNAFFDSPLIANGIGPAGNDATPPRIRALNLFESASHPRMGYVPAAATGIRFAPDAKVVAVELLDGDAEHTLAPSRIVVAADAMPVKEVLFNQSSEVSPLFQGPGARSDFGYPRMHWGSLGKQDSFPFWFTWETTAYKNNPNGPRGLVITAYDRLGKSVSHAASFGPQITDPPDQTVDPGALDGTTFTVPVTSYMGPYPNGMRGSPEDILTLSFSSVEPASSFAWAPVWMLDEGQGVLEVDEWLRIFSGHSVATGIKQDDLRVRIRKKAGGSDPTGPQTLLIRAASGVFPSIRHEVSVVITPACGTGPTDGALGPAPPEFSFIPGGTFTMGDQTGVGMGNEVVHTAYVSAFFMGQTEVTYAQWQATYGWAAAHGYIFTNPGKGKGANHPVQTVSWDDVVKWCNARSEQEGLTPCYYTNTTRTPSFVYRTGEVNVSNGMVCWGANGYRLPTEAEWEKAARGGLSGQNFPWGNTITHSMANYFSDASVAYDTSPTRGYHPSYQTGDFPYTSPVGSFAPNAYGLYDMCGNVWEWCHDWYKSYLGSGGNNYTGPDFGQGRVGRDGPWRYEAYFARVSARNYFGTSDTSYSGGFRLARGHR